MKLCLELFLPIILLLVGCHSHRDEVKEIDMSDIKGEAVLNFSEIAADCRLVRLETKPDVLLEGWFKVWVGDRYIVTWGNEEIHLFSAEGKHIRKLCGSGRGPGEYQHISCLTVDEKRNRLYFYDHGKDHSLVVVDLSTGCFLPSIEIPTVNFWEICLANDSVLYGVSGGRKAEYILSKLSDAGRFMAGIPSGEQAFGMYQNDPYLRVKGNSCYYMGYRADTLYEWKNGEKTPLYYFTGLKALTRGKDGSQGSAIHVYYENEERILAEVQFLKYMEAGPGKFVMTYAMDPVLYDISLKDDEMRKIKGIHIDELRHILEDVSLNFSEKYVSQIISALDFRKWAEHSDLPVYDSFKDLSEDDNPLLLIGKLP